jgi:G3E family GTPase
MILIAGSLGSGKTTLLQHLVTCADRKIAILMNEFGEIAIDSKIIQGKHIEMTELAGGCVCCSLAGEFEAAIEEIIEKVRPDLIAVETTGVAEPDAVIFDVEESLPQIRLDSVIVLADADAMINFPDLGYVTRAQFETADVILVNKVDLVGEDELDEVEERLDEVNPGAVMFRTVRCELPTDLLFGFDRPARDVSRPPPRDHTENIQSFTFTSEEVFDHDRLTAVLEDLPESVYRAKGFVRTRRGQFLFNAVAGRVSFEACKASQTDLVFIGYCVESERNVVIQSLNDCRIP